MEWSESLPTVLGGVVILFALQGLLVISVFIYGFLVYPLVSEYPSNDVIGGVATYSIFVLLMALVLIVLHRVAGISETRTHAAFTSAAGLVLLAFPAMPLLWSDRLAVLEPSPGYVYGFEVVLWPAVVLSGLALLLLPVFEKRHPAIQPPKRVGMALYSFLAGLIIVLSFWASLLDYQIAARLALEVRATPFFLLPNVAGVVVLVDTLYVHRSMLGLSGFLQRIRVRPRLAGQEQGQGVGPSTRNWRPLLQWDALRAHWS